MIIVHDIFVCKPGNASKLAKLFKEWADTQKQTYVMTDMTGQWHRVIVASTHDSLAAYEENFKKMMADSPENRAMNEKFKDVNDMYSFGQPRDLQSLVITTLSALSISFYVLRSSFLIPSTGSATA